MYSPHTWTTGETITASLMNHLETGVLDAAGDLRAFNIYQPHNYGAVGNGVADDLTAINSTIAALTAGSTLLFPAGKTYKVSNTVLISRIPGVTVLGEGATITSTATGSTSRVLSLESCVGATVRGITLKHSTAGTRQNDADGLAIRRCSDFLVSNVRVPYVYSVGIRVGGSIRGTVRDCYVRDTLADGIGVYGAVSDATGSITASSSSLTSTSAKFTEADIGGFVQVTGAGTSGATLTATITGYTSPDTVTLSISAATTVSGAAVKIARHSEDITIEGSHLYNTADDSISSVGYLTLAGIPAAPNKNISIIGNTIRNCGARGILTAGQNRGTIADNVVESCSAAGIFIHTESSAGGSFGSTDVQVHGNIVVSANTAYPTSNYGAIAVGSGVDAYPTTGVTIRGNTIRGGGSYYVGVGSDSGSNTAVSTTDVLVDGNICLGGNGANAGINVVKTTDVMITGNIIDKAYRSAISNDSNVAGVVVISNNNITASDQGAGGFSPIAAVTGAVVDNNLIDGVLGGAPQIIAPPASVMYADASAVWWGANGAVLHRFSLARPSKMRYVNFQVGTAAGNIQVGVVKINPASVTSWTAMPMNSGVIACPAAGAIHLDLGATTLDPGEYALFFWASSTTLAVPHYLGSAGYTASQLILGGTYSGGLTASGSGSFSNRYLGGLTVSAV